MIGILSMQDGAVLPAWECLPCFRMKKVNKSVIDHGVCSRWRDMGAVLKKIIAGCYLKQHVDNEPD